MRQKGIAHLFLLVVVVIIGIGAIGYLAYQNSQLRTQSDQPASSTEFTEEKVSPTVTGKPTPTPDPTANWETFSIDMFKLSFKLPPELPASDISKTESPGEKGMMICWTFPLDNSGLIKSVRAGGQCNPNRFGVITISTDFEVGRMGMFSDTFGYEVDGNTIYYLFISGTKTVIPNDLANIVKSSGDVEILKITGKSEYYEPMNADLPVGGTPGEGKLGAIIMTGNDKYPAISIEMDLDSNLNETMFDQILSTFKIGEQYR